MANKFADYQGYRIVQDEKNAILVMQCLEGGKFKTFDVTKDGLREVADIVGFSYEQKWTTQQFGSKLIDYINQLPKESEQSQEIGLVSKIKNFFLSSNK